MRCPVCGRRLHSLPVPTRENQSVRMHIQVHLVPHGIISTRTSLPARLHSSAQHFLHRFSFLFVLIYPCPCLVCYSPFRSSFLVSPPFALPLPFFVSCLLLLSRCCGQAILSNGDSHVPLLSCHVRHHPHLCFNDFHHLFLCPVRQLLESGRAFLPFPLRHYPSAARPVRASRLSPRNGPPRVGSGTARAGPLSTRRLPPQLPLGPFREAGP